MYRAGEEGKRQGNGAKDEQQEGVLDEVG